ncbi:tautomerase family protein [Gulosibacter faecalis]|jgi:4-oxalocrotonate tautomerase|uniref:4-oxalocrotonate tautomerase family protein n=1 Tax=Gulosibacter faecalis TaxID=272240 RepID=A0ABW5UVK4_9MICO|nr:4-oxalocrotonate tautomerase family protein [Gulosibacter faecalis]
MPLIDISIAAGRTPEQLRALIDGVHRVAEETVGAASENITVLVREIEPAHWSRGNQTIRERVATSASAPSTDNDVSN